MIETKKENRGIKWSNIIRRYRYAILAFWILLVCPIGFCSVSPFLASTVTMSEALAEQAKSVESPKQAIIRKQGLQEVTLSLLLEKNADSSGNSTFIDGSSMLYSSTRDFALDIESNVRTYLDRTVGEDRMHVSSPEAVLDNLQVSSYYTFEERRMETLGRNVFITDEGKTTFISITAVVSSNERPNSDKRVEEAVRYVASCGESDLFRVSITSCDALETEQASSMENDSKYSHNVTAPIAVIFLIATLGGIRMVIVPILTIVSSMLGGIALLLQLTKVVDVSNGTPVLTGAMTVALSIDYCLFMLSRFKEEGVTGRSQDKAIGSVVEHSGHIIAVSGFILSGCCLGFLVLPFQFVSSMGPAIIIVAAVSVSVNLTLVPAVLHVLTELSSKTIEFSTLLAGFRYENVELHDVDSTSEKENDGKLDFWNDENTFVESCSDSDSEQEVSPKKENDVDAIYKKQGKAEDLEGDSWFRLGRLLISPRGGLLVLFSLSSPMLPVCYFSSKLKLSFSSRLTYPFHGPAHQTLMHLGKKFGYGMFYTTELWFELDELSGDDSILREDHFRAIHVALEALTGDEFPATPTISSYAGITTLGGEAISFPRYKSAIDCGTDCWREDSRTIAFLSNQTFMMPDSRSTCVTANLIVQPSSSDGVAWIISVRHKLQWLKEEGKLGALNFKLLGAATVYDVMDSNISAFPSMVCLSLTAVFFFMAWSFQSFAIPFLSLLSVILTQAFVYGAAVLVYVYGVLDFLNIQSLSKTGDIHWCPPLLSFMLVLGLGLDYDTFFIGRVLEYRKLGYSHDSAIVLSLCKTRKVITAAGIIMAISFGGLLHSDMVMLNQFGFVMVVAILMDTFVVRTTILPILLRHFGEWTWYPRDLPPVTKDILEPQGILNKSGKGQKSMLVSPSKGTPDEEEELGFLVRHHMKN